MGLLYDSSFEAILTEAFYGKIPELKEAEKELSKIIQMCYDIEQGKGKVITDTKENKRVEDLLTKAFKVNEVNITWYTCSILGAHESVNAFTMPQFLTVFKSKNNNMSDPKNINANIWVDTQLVTRLEMTPGELMSVILHELGHCFDASILGFLSKIPLGFWYSRDGDMGIHIPSTIKVIAQQLLLTNKYGTGIIRDIDRVLNRLIQTSPQISRLITTILMIFREFRGFMGRLRAPLLFTMNPIVLILDMIQPSNIFGYNGEKLADSFATAYGYGPDLVTMQGKMMKNKHMLLAKTGSVFLDNIYDIISLPMRIIVRPLDPHPDGVTRIMAQIRKLKNDLKDPSLDPKLRKELLEDLNEMEQYVKDVSANPDKHRIVSSLYNKILIEAFKGRIDIRELFDVLGQHEY